MAMESGEVYLTIPIQVNGGILKLKVMVFTLGKTVIGMKESGNLALSMAREQIYL